MCLVLGYSINMLKYFDIFDHSVMCSLLISYDALLSHVVSYCIMLCHITVDQVKIHYILQYCIVSCFVVFLSDASVLHRFSIILHHITPCTVVYYLYYIYIYPTGPIFSSGSFGLMG